MRIGRPGSDASLRSAKRLARRILAHPSVNPAVTAAIKPWAHSLTASTLLRVPVKRIVEARSPYCDGPVLLDTGGVDAIASMLYWQGDAGWEPETLPIFLRLIQPGMTVLDIGANTGLFSLLAARRSPSVRVHAIEPVPRVFQMLEANVARNHLTNLSCHRLAISDREGIVPMYVPQEEVPVMASMLPGWRPGADQIDVDAVTVDGFATGLGNSQIDVIKIDTEGTEHTVLAGAARTLSVHHPFIVCEVLSAGDTAEALTEQLEAADYLFYLLAKEGPRPTERILGNATGTCHNYLFVPRSRLDEARSRLGL